MIGAAATPCDVLWIGTEEPADLGDLERAGLRVERRPSLVAALDRLRDGPAQVAVVHAGAVAGREPERLGALRAAGAASVLEVLPPSDAWRADRALAAGADACLTLPAAPGVLLATTALLARASGAPPWTPGSAGGPPAGADLAEAGVRLRPWLEGLVAEIATMNRVLEQYDRVLDQVHGAFQRRSGADRCSVLVLDRRRGVLTVERAAPPIEGVPAPVVAAPDGLAARVAERGAAILVPDVTVAADEIAPLVGRPDRRYRSRSCLVLPLRGSEGVVGVACLTDRRGGEPFGEEDLAPLGLLADQSGQALENAAKFRQLRELASVDELTGIANRREFRQALEREFERARRYDRQLTLCILDLDHFKQYNDRCGHQAGDRALSKVGEILRTSFREADVVARYGGEEFAVILPETGARPGKDANPFPFLERLRRRIEETAFPGEEKLPTGKLTVSGGVACFPDDASTLDDLVREADRALYASKARGRNTITFRGNPIDGPMPTVG